MTDGGAQQAPWRQLAEEARVLMTADGAEQVCGRIVSRRLTAGSTGAIVAIFSAGCPHVSAATRLLIELWSRAAGGFSSEELCAALRTTAFAEAFARAQELTRVVWTGPDIEGSFLRLSREVLLQLLRDVRVEVLAVGYWILDTGEEGGFIEVLVHVLAERIKAGAAVTIVIDERVRSDGLGNRRVLSCLWPVRDPPARVLTWRPPSGDRHLKLHAKVLVADRRDELVTSANLTAQAMNRNFEMGVRVGPAQATVIVEHLHRLEAAGVLVPFIADRGL